MSRNLIEVFELSTRDRIVQYMRSSAKGDIYLTDKEQEYMDMLDYCDDVIRSYPGSKEIQLANMVVEKYGCSLSQAKRALYDARYVHGTTAKPVRQYERMRINEILWKVIEATKDGDEKAVAMKGIELLIKINKLDDFELDEKTEDDATPKNVIIRPAFVPEQLGVTLPDNIDEVIDKLRKRTKFHQNAIESFKE